MVEMVDYQVTRFGGENLSSYVEMGYAFYRGCCVRKGVNGRS